MRRGAATDLMKQVGDALAAPRSAPVAGGRSICYLIESRISRQMHLSHRRDATHASFSSATHPAHALVAPAPEGVSRVGGAGTSVELSCTGTARRTRNTRRSDVTDHFCVTSEARAGCEHVS